ncbi:MAG: transporter substrate-binding protein [Myxococcaceae bacterium]|nr:transporter substrate-binding protein [Myxococcaceae bacterium]
MHSGHARALAPFPAPGLHGLRLARTRRGGARARLLPTLLCLLAALGCSESKPAAPNPAKPAPSVAAPAAVDDKPSAKARSPLRIAYSDWPGWVAWEIGLQKGWFQEEGVAVEFKWFEYVPSMEAFSAGKVDAVTMTNGDALVTGSSGAKSVGILINDYSNGNDMVVAKPGIKNMTALKGKKIGVEVGFLSHLLLINALKSVGLTDKDVELVNVPTDQTPQVLKAGEVSAIVAWQPNSGQALKEVPGAKAVFTSADVPGLIYDLLYVSPKSLGERRDDWTKVVKVWFRISEFLADPAHLDEAAKIMAARVGLSADQYKALMSGTHFLDLKGNLQHFARGDSLMSVYGGSKIVDAFQLENKIYKEPVAYEQYLDPSIVESLAARLSAK